jgi:hypothetical protein
MPPDLQKKLIAFVGMEPEAFLKLPQNIQNQHFENFVAYHVLRRWHVADLDKKELASVMTGSSRDNQLDTLAVMINDKIVRDDSHAEEILEEVDEPTVAYVFIQSTTSSSFMRQKMNEFLGGVENFHADQPYFGENEALQRKRAVKKLIQTELGEAARPRTQLYLYYVALGRWREESERNPHENALGWRKYAEERTQLRSPSDNTAEVEVIDADRLRECIRHNEVGTKSEAAAEEGREDYERTIDAPALVRLPQLDEIAKGYMGYVLASEYLKLLEREDGQGLLESLSLDNVRAFQGLDNDVNAEIAETIASASRNRFVLLNNGVTIVAKDAAWREFKLHLKNYRIVNGLQTSYVLHRQRKHLSPSSQVYVPMKIVVTKDLALRDAIVHATNRQTAVAESQQVMQQPFARKLWQAFNERRSRPGVEPLWFERRDGECDDDPSITDRNGVFSMRDLLGAVTSTLLRQPHVAAQGEAAMLMKIPGQLFNDAHHSQPYLTGARVLYLVRRFLERRRDEELQRFEFYLAYGLFHLAADASMTKNFAIAKCEEDCRQLERRLDNRETVERALKLGAEALRQIIKSVDRNSKLWRDLTRTKASLTTPFERKLRAQKSKLKWT